MNSNNNKGGMNVKLADIINEQGKNVYVYTNTTILWGWIMNNPSQRKKGYEQMKNK